MTEFLRPYGIDVPWLRIVVSRTARAALSDAAEETLVEFAVSSLHRLRRAVPADEELEGMNLRRFAELYVRVNARGESVRELAIREGRSPSTVSAGLERFARAVLVPYDVRQGRRMGSLDTRVRSPQRRGRQ